jgi:hypothetical protein
MSRVLAWFSCGAASAVAAKEAISMYGKSHEVIVVNCDTRSSEHQDNYRFSEQIEKWLGVKITYIKNDTYGDVDDVFRKTRYMSGPRGARCTTELKKNPRKEFALADDIHVFGFTAGEEKRMAEFESRNPDMLLAWPLIVKRISKGRCLQIIKDAGIELPAMYRLGFANNNCPGCVKATSPWYWDRVRKYFPDVFATRAAISREIGCRLIEYQGERIFLDELPSGPFRKRKERLSCGPECGVQLDLIQV